MNIGTEMVRKRILAIEDADDARIDTLRKELREKRGPEAAYNPLSRLKFLTVVSLFRRRRTLVIP